MNINKNYIMAGMLATAFIAPVCNETDSHAAETRITTANVHLRAGAGTNYSSMGIISKGTKVTYISTSGSWTKVQYNSKTGYIHSDYLAKGESTSTGSTSTTMYVTASSLNVRSGAGSNYSVVAGLSKGTAVTVSSTSNGWSKITANGVTGYVSSQYLSSTKPSTSTGSTSTTSKTMYVTASSLNVRSGAGTNYSVVTSVSKGTAVTVSSTTNGWSKITVNGVTGYVSSEYLSSTKPSSSTGSTSTTSKTMYVTANSLNVRSGAGTGYSVVTKVSKGTAVTVSSTTNGWSKITVNGVTGYVSSEYLSSTKPSSTSKVDAVLNFANKQLGKPYVYGAEGPNSFDCSGFTYYVYKNAAGITLPRTSSAQSQYGTTVSKSNLKAGDLVFFDTSGSNNGVVTHVGIYVGNGQMIHASAGTYKKIVKVSMNTTYWNNAYVRAKRVL